MASDMQDGSRSTLEEDLVRGTEALGVSLTSDQIDQFAQYAALLAEWNRRMNLTRISPEEVVPLHFLDSLAVCRAIEVQVAKRLVDVGTGAGFPGIPLKIAFPSLSLTLLDSTRKRLAFLEAVVSALALASVATVHARAEEAAHWPSHREAYDVVTARAVARLNVLAEFLLPFARLGGAVVALKSAGSAAEVAEAQTAITRLGGRLERVESVVLPGTQIERHLITLRKVRRTPPAYPRSPAQIQARPLA